MGSTARRAEARAHPVSAGRWAAPAGLAAVLSLIAACGGPAAAPPGSPRQALLSTPAGSVGQIEVRQIEARPRLTLVSRDGDPAPALVATIATDLGSAATVALASVVEGRLRAAGVDVDASVDRSAFRIRALAAEPGRAAAFLGALAAAFAQPIAGGTPEVELARQRVQALRQSPLDAPELLPIAACTGRLGLAGGEPSPDLATAAGARELEGFRRAALTAGRTSIAAVGPAPFCEEAAAALERVDAWPPGPAPSDPWPQADVVATYASNQIARRGARITIAARVTSAQAAASAAERLGAPDSPLRARLSALPYPWRAVEVLGVARPRGGCVSVTVEAEELPGAAPVEAFAGVAAALVRQEVRAELAAPASPAVATRQILTAADPREAGARASWWALSSVAPDRPKRWATALAVPAGRGAPGTGGGPPPAARLEAEIARALAPGAQPPVERRLAVERGQGEVWVLLASPCGVVEEGVYDAGATALAALTAAQMRRGDDGVALEPWITVDGVGVIAHAALRDGGETPGELGRRVAGAAARALGGTAPSAEALVSARAAALTHLEQIAGRQAAAMDALAAAVAPEHPSWLQPFGVWDRLAGGALETVRLRWQALQGGPLRAAVLANADAAQGAAAAAAIDRWIPPRAAGALGPRPCAAPDLAAPRAGRYEVRLPRATPLAQVLIGVPVPQASALAGRSLARLTAAALDGSGGLLAAALGAPTAGGGAAGGGAAVAPAARLEARASAQVLGGARAMALVIDVRAPGDQLDEAAARVRALLAGLAQRVTEADLSRAEGSLARRERDARADPRRRLIGLWSGAPAPAAGGAPKASLAAWRSWMAAALGEGALVIVDARPE